METQTRSQSKRKVRDERIKELWKSSYNPKKDKGIKTLIAEKIAAEVDTSLTTVLRVINHKKAKNETL